MANKKESPLWLKRTNEEIEGIVAKLAKEGNSPSKIGLILRDSYGIPTTKLMGKKISHILKENKLKSEFELDDLLKKAKALRNHLEKNKQDKTAKKGLITIESRIMRFSRYLKRKKLLPQSWEYKDTK